MAPGVAAPPAGQACPSTRLSTERSKELRESATPSKNSLSVASATRYRITLSIARPTGPSGGAYRALIASWVRPTPSEAISRSASSDGKRPLIPDGTHRIGITVLDPIRIGSPTATETGRATRILSPKPTSARSSSPYRLARCARPGSHASGCRQASPRPGRLERRSRRSISRTCSESARSGDAGDVTLVPPRTGPLARWSTAWRRRQKAVSRRDASDHAQPDRVTNSRVPCSSVLSIDNAPPRAAARAWRFEIPIPMVDAEGSNPWPSSSISRIGRPSRSVPRVTRQVVARAWRPTFDRASRTTCTMSPAWDENPKRPERRPRRPSRRRNVRRTRDRAP